MMPPAPDTLAERLRFARQKGEINQRALARLSGVSTSYVSLLELGQRTNPEVEKIGAIARTLGVTVDWLAFGQGATPTSKRVKAAVEVARAAHAAQQPEASP
jgi:transcriptional regulator with XRE-family HTH domain